MTKKICISGYYGFDNFGDETILKILVQNLKKFQYPPEITVFSSNPHKTAAELSVKSIKSFDVFNVIKTLFHSDCLISGGGSLLQDVTSGKSLIYYLFVLYLAYFFRKKIIIFAQGVGPINNKFLRALTFFVLKRADCITVRDENSLNMLLNSNVKASLVSDPVWNIELYNVAKTETVGIQLRDFATLTDDFLVKFAHKVNDLFSNNEICLISLQNSIDMPVLVKFKNILMSINPQLNVKIAENNSNDNVIKLLASLKLLMAMRYHACLIAIKAGVKLLPICYDAKVENLAQQFGLKSLNIVKYDNIGNILDEFLSEKTKYDIQYVNKLMFDFSTIGKYTK